MLTMLAVLGVCGLGIAVGIATGIDNARKGVESTSQITKSSTGIDNAPKGGRRRA